MCKYLINRADVLGLQRSEQFCRLFRPTFLHKVSHLHILFFYISCLYVYSASVCPVVDGSLHAYAVIVDVPSASYIRHVSLSINYVINATSSKHECDMHIVHIYHRNTTHITSTQYIHTCKETLTKALNQVNVKTNLCWCSLWVSLSDKICFFFLLDFLTFLYV